MALPVPAPGLVIRYTYLWRSDHRQGREQAVKSRPAVIVLAVAKKPGQSPTVVVAPITHRDLGNGRGIEIPGRVKAVLGLDEERSWVVTDDLNAFEWPGFDLEPIPGKPGVFSYGFIPATLFRQVREAIQANKPPVRPVVRT